MTGHKSSSGSSEKTPTTGQLAEWKKAIAAQRKQKRRDRWKRPDPPVTGVRIPPPSDSGRTGQDAS